jgi:HEAT repeat protein
VRFFVTMGLTVFPVVLVSGCGQAPPTLAGGKPVAHWVQALQDPDAKVRKEAAFKLGNVGPTDPAAFPALRGALKDRDAAVRREAILALLKHGPGAREAVPELTRVQNTDRDVTVRACAAKALEKLREGK